MSLNIAQFELLKELDPIVGNIVDKRKRKPLKASEIMATHLGLSKDENDVLILYPPIRQEFLDWMNDVVNEGGDPTIVFEALYVNTLTEDNLPYYAFQILTAANQLEGFVTWSRRWIREEREHSDALEQYGRASGIFLGSKYDKYIIGRNHQLDSGMDIGYQSPETLLPYVSIQEYATYIAHSNLGTLVGGSGEKIMTAVGSDEMSHFTVYSRLTKAGLKINPDLMLQGIAEVIRDFDMPGEKGIIDFAEYARSMAIAGVFGPISKLYSIRKCVEDWDIESLRPTSEEAKAARDFIIGYVTDEKFERAAKLAELIRGRRLSRLPEGSLIPIEVGHGNTIETKPRSAKH